MSRQVKPPPTQWPQSIQYVTTAVYHSSVFPSAKQFIQGTPPHSSIMDPKHLTKVAIRKITDLTHPACGQCGLFTVKKVPSGTIIIDYFGEIHCDDRPGSDYDLSLHRFLDGVAVGIDASRIGNEARFVNDYRGIKNKPNAEFHEYRTVLGELRMSIRSSDEIKKGEEILVSYGKSWWRSRTSEISNDSSPRTVTPRQSNI